MLLITGNLLWYINNQHHKHLLQLDPVLNRSLLRSDVDGNALESGCKASSNPLSIQTGNRNLQIVLHVGIEEAF